MTNLFKWKHYESNIILLCVRWYLKYPLLYVNLEEMMAERELSVSHTTIILWVHQYFSIINRKVKKYLKPTGEVMKRNMMENLIKWKRSKNKLPLMLLGTRQMGKTYILKEFAESRYENHIYINFEHNAEFKNMYEKTSTRSESFLRSNFSSTKRSYQEIH